MHASRSPTAHAQGQNDKASNCAVRCAGSTRMSRSSALVLSRACSVLRAEKNNVAVNPDKNPPAPIRRRVRACQSRETANLVQDPVSNLTEGRSCSPSAIELRRRMRACDEQPRPHLRASPSASERLRDDGRLGMVDAGKRLDRPAKKETCGCRCPAGSAMLPYLPMRPDSFRLRLLMVQ